MLNKRNRTTTICLIIVVGLLLTACGNANENNTGNNVNANNSTIVETIVPDVEEPNADELLDEQASNEANNAEVPVLEEEATEVLATPKPTVEAKPVPPANKENNSKPSVEVKPVKPPVETKPDKVEPPVDKETNTEAPIVEEETTPQLTTQVMVAGMLEKVEQPRLMDVSAEMVADLYHLDTAMLEQFTIKMPMMNVKTNEIAILQVKDVKDIAAIEDAVKQRAADIQKQFESYLPDQYENSKNYKVVVKDNYVLFVISEEADSLVNEFNSFFE